MGFTTIKPLSVDRTSRGFRAAKRVLPKRIGKLAINHFLTGFSKGGGQTDASIGGWKKRKRETRETRGNPILIKTFKLFKSIRLRRANFTTILIGTRGIPYARRHNEGDSTMPKREFLGDSIKLNIKIMRRIKRTLKEFGV